MNERIKKLADKIWSLNIEPNPHFQLCLQSFAESIVQECARVADLADENKCEWIGGNVLTHFGVEK